MQETKLYRDFIAYHAKNPIVYELIKRFAQQVINKGKTKHSVYAIYNRARWEVEFDTTTSIAGDVKMSNNHQPYYARLWLKEHPQHPHFFQINRLAGEGHD